MAFPISPINLDLTGTGSSLSYCGRRLRNGRWKDLTECICGFNREEDFGKTIREAYENAVCRLIDQHYQEGTQLSIVTVGPKQLFTEFALISRLFETVNGKSPTKKYNIHMHIVMETHETCSCDANPPNSSEQAKAINCFVTEVPHHIPLALRFSVSIWNNCQELVASGIAPRLFIGIGAIHKTQVKEGEEIHEWIYKCPPELRTRFMQILTVRFIGNGLSHAPHSCVVTSYKSGSRRALNVREFLSTGTSPQTIADFLDTI